MYSNICNKKKCTLDTNTKRCYNNSKSKVSKSSEDCLCNIESGRCVKKKNPLDDEKGQIEAPRIRREIDGNRSLLLSSIKPKLCILPNWGWTSLSSIKNRYKLPPTSFLKFGILKATNECVVYNNYYKFYHVSLNNQDDMIIELPNYDIIVKPIQGRRKLDEYHDPE